MTTFLSAMIVCVVSVGLAQEPTPTLPADAKLTFRDAQHKQDSIDKQIKDLTLQFMQLQSQAQNQLTSLTDQQKKAQTATDDAWRTLTAGIDEKKWKCDRETLTCSAVPPPANASSSAGPPKIEQAKK